MKNIILGLSVAIKNKKVILYYVSKSGRSKEYFCLAQSKDGLDFEFLESPRSIKLPEDSNYSLSEFNLHPRADYFDHGRLTLESVHRFSFKYLVFYHSQVSSGNYRVGYALFDQKKNLIYRASSAIWESPTKWRDDHLSFIGVVRFLDRFISYWNVGGNSLYAVVYPDFKIRKPTEQLISPILSRSEHNPLISPLPGSVWEEFTTFNPAAVYAANKVHILYRAQGFNYVSVVGYASSSDGVHIDLRHSEPAYFPRESFEYRGPGYPRHISHFYSSGGGYGGIEDPRATIIGDKLFMVYVAYDGVSPPRIALTSIALDDFLAHRWLWEKPVLISKPGIIDKSAVIFPEKINGKYVIMHRVFPHILIDFEDDLAFDGKTRWLPGKYKISTREKMWDSRKIGAGAPPLKTKDGWLLIYYATCDQEGASRYLIGAMLLDLKDPTKVLCRSKMPILAPDVHYENVGFKAGVVYPCGAVIIGEKLFVYYGGADSYVCVATANLDQFLKELKQEETPHLEASIISKII